MLTFKSSPLFYQTIASLGVGGRCKLDELPLEVHQAFLLSLALLHHAKVLEPYRILVIGCGGGSIPGALTTGMLHGLSQVDAVDISEEVLQACTEHFGLAEEEGHLRLHCADGIAWLQEREAGSFDCIMCDAADGTEPDRGLEAPHRGFVDPHFMEEQVVRCLSSQGVYALNVVGDRQSVLEVARAVIQCFGGGYAVSIEPNIIIFGCKAHQDCYEELTHKELAEATAGVVGLPTICEAVMLNYVLASPAFAAQKSLIGWMPLDAFSRRLEDPAWDWWDLEGV